MIIGLMTSCTAALDEGTCGTKALGGQAQPGPPRERV